MPPFFEQFQAVIKAMHGGDPITISTASAPHLLETAVDLAMHEMSAEEVLALVAQRVTAMQAALAKPRRKHGDVVYLSKGAGFGAEDGAYRVRKSWGPNSSCAVCGNLDCQEWGMLDQLDAQGIPTGECAHHVSECHMHDAPAKGNV